MQPCWAIGLMSGTSMDGIDAALIKTDGTAVTEFGPVLFSKILGLNDTQSGIVAIIFKYCDEKGLPLLDLKDFKKTLQYISNEGKEEIREEYGNIPHSLMQKIRGLQLSSDYSIGSGLLNQNEEKGPYSRYSCLNFERVRF